MSARFVGANPRNNLRLEGTFAAVEVQEGNTWRQVRSDEDWGLVYEWKRTNWLLGHSEVTVKWETGGPSERDRTMPGTYRIRYYGDARNLLGIVTAFSGTSNSFVLT